MRLASIHNGVTDPRRQIGTSNSASIDGFDFPGKIRLVCRLRAPTHHGFDVPSGVWFPRSKRSHHLGGRLNNVIVRRNQIAGRDPGRWR